MVSIVIASCAILVSLITCILRYKKLEPDWLRLFAYFLFLDFSVQIVGYLYSSILKRSNHFIFNILLIFEFGFYFFIFHKALYRTEFKLFVKLLSILFLLFAAYNLAFGESLYRFNQHTNSLGTLLLLITCLLYFAESFMSEFTINFFRTPMFWITTGLFFYYAGNGLYLSLLSYILKNNLDRGGEIYSKMTVGLNVLLYALFTIGFLCNWKWKKRNS
jgi:hypothetical protein